jgi:hypothetical protein
VRNPYDRTVIDMARSLGVLHEPKPPATI